MSKKLFLQRSYAEVVKVGNDIFERNDFEDDELHGDDELQQGEPGESLITPKMRFFPYLRKPEQMTTASKRRRNQTCTVTSSDCYGSNEEVVIIDSDSNELPIINKPKKRKRHSKSVEKPILNEREKTASQSLSSTASCVEDNDGSTERTENEKAIHDNVAMSAIEIVSSDEENTDSSSDSENDFYHDIMDLPIFARYQKGVGTLSATKNLLDVTGTKIAKIVPFDVSENVCFVVSSSAVGHQKNIYSDGMGAWINTGMKVTHINYDKRTASNAKFICDSQYGLPYTFKVRRSQYINKSEPELHKVVVCLSDHEGHNHDLIFVQYYFEKEEKIVKVLPHGNSNQNQSYVRTKESTKNKIKDMLHTKKPKQIFHEILDAQGGIVGLKGPGEIPRNRQQISDLKKRKNVNNEGKDELKVLMDKLTTERLKHNNTFLFDLTTDPELIVFIADEYQLKDLETYCTNPGNFCILGIDPTFNVGNYMVTLTSYRNLKLKNARGLHPVMAGPVLIHQRKLEHSYFELPCKMIKYNSNLSGILAFGTDGEHNLQRAFEIFLPNAFHLLCDIHMRDNIKSKLTKLQISKGTAAQYLLDIFGRNFDEERQPGLVDAMSQAEFDKKLSDLKDIWTKRHINGLEFYLYFAEEKAPLVKNHMTAEIRILSGLGYPPLHYTQNANEALNRAFKNGLDKKLSLSEGVSRLQNFIKKQKDQVDLAVISCGEYQVLQEYTHLKVDADKFYRMGEKSKIAHLKKFNESEVVSKGKQKSSLIDSASKSNDKKLSIPISKCGVTKIPFEIVEKIYDNTNTLFSLNSFMVQSPGCASNHDQYIVASLTNPLSPHSVRVIHESGNIICDNQCIRWKTYKMCHHVLAVADSLPGMLKKYFEWHKSLKDPGMNLMSLSTHNLPNGRGRKGIKSTSIRKGKPNVKTKQPVTYCHNLITQTTPPVLPDPIPGSYMISMLDYCNPNVSKCFGCQGNLKTHNEIPPPPTNLVIVSKMKRKFFQNGTLKETGLSNVYFHFNEQCVKSKDCYFLPTILYCPDSLKPHLQETHRDFLKALNVPI